MIEIIENAIQLAVVGVCLLISGYHVYRLRNRAWGILAFFYATMFLGDLYWQLHRVFYHDNPQFYIAEISWYASYIFLVLVLRQIQTEEIRRIRHPVLWIVPVFVIGMCVFFMQKGSYVGNLICALLMGLLLWRSLQGLLSKAAAGSPQKRFYLAILLFCLIEYAMWTISCFWMGDTLANPYFWFDAMFTICMGMLLPLLRRVVGR